MMPVWANDPCRPAGWGNWMLFHGVFSLLLLLLAIAGIVAFIRLGAHRRAASGDKSNTPPGLEILERRYSAGEIDREEYLQKKDDLGG